MRTGCLRLPTCTAAGLDEVPRLHMLETCNVRGNIFEQHAVAACRHDARDLSALAFNSSPFPVNMSTTIRCNPIDQLMGPVLRRTRILSLSFAFRTMTKSQLERESPATAQAQVDSYMQGVLALMRSRNILACYIAAGSFFASSHSPFASFYCVHPVHHARHQPFMPAICHRFHPSQRSHLLHASH